MSTNVTPRSRLRERLMVVLTACVALAAAGAARAGDAVDFRRDVFPILSNNCFTCHGPDAKARKAKLRLDLKSGALRTDDPIILAGKRSESTLFERITSHDPDDQMPPPKSGKSLTQAQIETLGCWIDQGAVWKGHWAFEPVIEPRVPTPKRAGWARNPIDAFVLARLETLGLEPAAPAADPVLARRLALDLTGLPLAVEDAQAFAADLRPDKYDRLVDRLLASPHHGERMAMDWLDDARYADTNGYQNDFARTMWPWRDWVIRASNANTPFDRFLTEQLAGDLLPNPTLEQRIATGFNRNNRTVTEAGSLDEEWRVENAVDRIETTATVFLGLTMGCARCHDHKYDPITQTDFYQFMGFFYSLNEQGVYTEQRGNVPPLVSLPTEADRKLLAELDKALEAARARKAPKNELDKLTKERDEVKASIPSVMIMEDAPKPRPLYVLKRGQYDQPDRSRALEPDAPEALSRLAKGVPRNRLGLVKWLLARDNPLTARVAVNRIWQMHFGVGLVKTQENFGVQGEPPSHPELLDWLAAEFVRMGWDQKALHRLIVTSAVYRQASRVEPSLLARDPENRLLGRGPRFRLPAELVRDNALFAAGLLTRRIGGPSIKPYQPAGLWEELAGGAGEAPYVQDHGPGLYRRSLYIYRKRTVPHPALATFDAPSREICQVRRPRTNTPLQALGLLNDVTYVEAARRLAERILEDGGPSDRARLETLFRRAVGRAPHPQELAVLERGLERRLAVYKADQDAAEKLINQGESPRVPGLDPARLAAFTATASVVLNLDETITVE